MAARWHVVYCMLDLWLCRSDAGISCLGPRTLLVEARPIQKKTVLSRGLLLDYCEAFENLRYPLVYAILRLDSKMQNLRERDSSRFRVPEKVVGVETSPE